MKESMPDITMYTGGSCDKKKSCYRHEATPNPYRQSYFAVIPVDTTRVAPEQICEYYSPMEINKNG